MAKISIFKKGISLMPGKFDLTTMTTPKPIKNKAKVLEYLKSVEAFQATTYTFKDPVDGSVLTNENVAFSDKGFIWSNVAIMLFEKYNVKLNDDFLKMFS